MKIKWEKLDENFLKDIAKMLKALSDPTRLKILNYLHKGEASVGTVVNYIQTSQANVSKHLQVLSNVKLIDSRRDGSTIYYRVSDPCVDELCKNICGGYIKLLKNKNLLFQII